MNPDFIPASLPTSPSSAPAPLELIVCDNDGCLMPEAPAPLDAAHFEPIAAYNRQAAAEGSSLPPLTIATGRPVPFVELLLRLVHAGEFPAICEHGALTYSLAENMARRDPALTAERRGMLSELREDLHRANPDWIFEAGKEGMVSVYVPEGGAAVDERVETVRELIDARGWPMKVNRTVTYVNLTFPEIDKGVALRRLLADRRINARHVLAIGDTAGDLPLRAVCGFFACPANATAEVRRAADYVSHFAERDGVIDILRRFTSAPALSRTGRSPSGEDRPDEV